MLLYLMHAGTVAVVSRAFGVWNFPTTKMAVRSPTCNPRVRSNCKRVSQEERFFFVEHGI
jgi:hypothetical protein